MAMPVEPAVLRASRIRKLRAAGALTEEQVARLSNLDFLIDSADDELDALLADLGIADPDEADDAEPAMAGMNSVRLRTRIRAAATLGDLEARDHFRTAYRALPVAERRESCTAAIWRGELKRPEDTREIVRAVEPDAEIRAALVEWRGAQVPAAADAQPTLFGHFAVFNTWTEVDSIWEGLFMERIAPGAFANTIKTNGDRMRVTFNHGRDRLGNLVLGSISSVAEDKIGAAYEVSMNDGVDPLLMSGLRRGQYGASFRFFVTAERIDEKPKPSAYNPGGIPERTILEAEVDEFGPVTFPQYPEASAQLRSLVPMRVTPTVRKPVDSGKRSTEVGRPNGQKEFTRACAATR